MFQILRALKLGRVLHFLNTAGMAGRSLWNVNQGYVGVKNMLNNNDNYRQRYLNPKERYNVVVSIEGIEIEKKRYVTSFVMIELLTSLSHVPSMELVITKCERPKWKRWRSTIDEK